MLELLFSKWSLIVSTITLIIFYIRDKYQYFARRGIPTPNYFPIVGNLQDLFLRRKTMPEMYKSMYDEFPKHRFFGIYEFTNPAYVLRDPELVKQICVKNFESFANHRNQVDEKIDPLFGCNLFSMENQRWKDMRATLTPAFTGSKLRKMFLLVAEIANENIQQLFKDVKEESGNDSNGMDVEAKNLMTQFATDAIATSVFGLKVNSIKNPKNDFFRMALNFSDFGAIQTIKFFLFMVIPKVMLLFNIKFFSSTIVDWFYDIVNTTIRTRREKNIHRPDLINMIMELMDERDNFNTSKATTTEKVEENSTVKRLWTDQELISQSMVFFLAGFETTSTQMSFICHELTVNPDVQKRLITEIDGMMLKNDGHIDFEVISQMKYLDMVVSETQRKWPPLFAIDRLCNKHTTIEDYDGHHVELQPGDGVQLPIHALHHDPQYFPDPDKFDPERFNEENRHKIIPCTFMPFGGGPRTCIGQRFALMEIKVIFIYLLTAFTFERSEKTRDPLPIQKGNFLCRTESGIWMKLKPRK